MSTVDERFWAKVQGGDVDTCWLWTAAKLPTGYGRFAITPTHLVYVHRYAYEAMVAPIPAGLQVDHLCRVRLCVNPWHLDPVTAWVNNRRSDSLSSRRARQTHCIWGHEFTPENTVPYSGRPGRRCRQCVNRRTREYQARRQAVSA